MVFHLLSARGRPSGGMASPANLSRNKSPHVAALVPQVLFDQAADEAHQRQVPLSQIIREALQDRYAPETVE